MVSTRPDHPVVVNEVRDRVDRLAELIAEIVAENAALRAELDAANDAVSELIGQHDAAVRALDAHITTHQQGVPA